MNAAVPVLDQRFVHLIDGPERPVTVADDVGMPQVQIGCVVDQMNHLPSAVLRASPIMAVERV
jgi:hypothetical protein